MATATEAAAAKPQRQAHQTASENTIMQRDTLVSIHRHGHFGARPCDHELVICGYAVGIVHLSCSAWPLSVDVAVSPLICIAFALPGTTFCPHRKGIDDLELGVVSFLASRVSTSAQKPSANLHRPGLPRKDGLFHNIFPTKLASRCTHILCTARSAGPNRFPGSYGKDPSDSKVGCSPARRESRKANYRK